MSDCLFCKIAGGEIPAAVVSETEDFLAFRDISPQAPTHVLAIPRRHLTSMNEVSEADFVGRLLVFARDVATQEGLSDGGYRLVINTNRDGGQTVDHLPDAIVHFPDDQPFLDRTVGGGGLLAFVEFDDFLLALRVAEIVGRNPAGDGEGPGLDRRAAGKGSVPPAHPDQGFLEQILGHGPVSDIPL